MYNYYNLDNFLCGCLMFMYMSYGDMGGDNKIKFFSGEGIIY